MPSELKDTLRKDATKLIQRVQAIQKFVDKKPQSNAEKKLNDISKSVDLEEEEKKLQNSDGFGDRALRLEDLKVGAEEELSEESFQQRFQNEFDSYSNDHPLKITLQVDVEATVQDIVE